MNELDRMKRDLELEGLKPDTLVFNKKFLERKVERCKQYQRVNSCDNCRVFMECTLIKEYLKILRGG